MTDCDFFVHRCLCLESKKVLLFPVLPPRPAPWSPTIIWWDSSRCIPFKYSSSIPIPTQTRCLSSNTVSVVWVRIRILNGISDLDPDLALCSRVSQESAVGRFKNTTFCVRKFFPILLLESQYDKNIGLDRRIRITVWSFRIHNNACGKASLWM